MDIIWVDAALMVSGEEIEGGEVLGTVQLVKEFTGEGQRAGVLDGLGIERAIIDTETKGSICFAGK